MDRKETYKAMMERVEQVRVHLGLNKSKFSQGAGLVPQTYNNFIGHQGSKPNVDLLSGIANRWGVNGDWLLTGQGSMFVKDRSRLTQPRIDETVAIDLGVNPQLGETVLRIPHSLVASARRIIVELREPQNRTEGGDVRIGIGDTGQSAEYLETARRDQAAAGSSKYDSTIGAPK